MALWSRITLEEALRRHAMVVNKIVSGKLKTTSYPSQLSNITKHLSAMDKDKFRVIILPVREKHGL